MDPAPEMFDPMAGMTRTACRSCGGPVIWVTLNTGARMPAEPDPTPGGNMICTGRGPDGPIMLVLRDRDRPDPGARYVSHFTVCPDAQKWRAKR